MKKIMLSVLCFVLTAGLLGGCRSKSPAGTDSPTAEHNDTTSATGHSSTEDFTGAEDDMSRSRRFSGMN